MKEKRLLEKVCRYHRIAHDKRLEAMICLYKDCIYIKLDVLYDDIRCRDTYHEIYISVYEQYLCIRATLLYYNSTEKLADKVIDVLIDWKVNQLFSFSDENKIIIRGGQSNGNQ